uniref:Uncharacterized protein n=1 Tax=Romanomermis culicivorax TaxID=13658 RepID=A0A915L752_ROMCU
MFCDNLEKELKIQDKLFEQCLQKHHGLTINEAKPPEQVGHMSNQDPMLPPQTYNRFQGGRYGSYTTPGWRPPTWKPSTYYSNPQRTMDIQSIGISCRHPLSRSQMLTMERRMKQCHFIAMMPHRRSKKPEVDTMESFENTISTFSATNKNPRFFGQSTPRETHKNIGAIFDIRNQTLTLANRQVAFNVQHLESPVQAVRLPPPPAPPAIPSPPPTTSSINEITLGHPIIAIKNVLIQPYADHVILGTIWSRDELRTPSLCLVSSNNASSSISIEPAIINLRVEHFPVVIINKR